MNIELPSFKNVCAIIQNEEVHRKVMHRTITPGAPDVRPYLARPSFEEKLYKGKCLNLKWKYYHNIGHSIARC
jgi:hypothetical protein